MNLTVNYPLTYAPASHPSAFRLLQCPPIVTCPRYPSLNFVSEPSDKWNCNLCGSDAPYVSLYETGDIIPMQFNLPDIRNINNLGGTLQPSVGWRQSDLSNVFWYVKAEVYSLTDCVTPVFTLVDDFCSDWWVGYSDKVGSIQTLFVDTSIIAAAGLAGFYLKITTVNNLLAPNIVLYSEPFFEVSCQTTQLLQAEYSTIDCENRDYRNPASAAVQGLKVPFVIPAADSLTPFYASWRFEGTFKATGNSSESTFNDNDIVTNQRITDTYELALFPIAAYAFDILKAIIRGSTVTIDGVEYTNFGDISQNLEGRGFLPIISCETICKINNLGCD